MITGRCIKLDSVKRLPFYRLVFWFGQRICFLSDSESFPPWSPQSASNFDREGWAAPPTSCPLPCSRPNDWYFPLSNFRNGLSPAWLNALYDVRFTFEIRSNFTPVFPVNSNEFLQILVLWLLPVLPRVVLKSFVTTIAHFGISAR